MARTPLREVDLDALMARLAQGDRAAFAPLYAELSARASRLVARRAPAASAPDIAHSALVNVFARASEFTPGRACLPWFYAVVANELRSVTRRDARVVLTGELPDLAAEDDLEADYMRRELERALELAVDSLDEDSSQAICALLGRVPMPNIPAPTFRKRVSRAYARLRLLLGVTDAG